MPAGALAPAQQPEWQADQVCCAPHARKCNASKAIAFHSSIENAFRMRRPTGACADHVSAHQQQQAQWVCCAYAGTSISSLCTCDSRGSAGGCVYTCVPPCRPEPLWLHDCESCKAHSSQVDSVKGWRLHSSSGHVSCSTSSRMQFGLQRTAGRGYTMMVNMLYLMARQTPECFQCFLPWQALHAQRQTPQGLHSHPADGMAMQSRRQPLHPGVISQGSI